MLKEGAKALFLVCYIGSMFLETRVVGESAVKHILCGASRVGEFTSSVSEPCPQAYPATGHERSLQQE